MHHKISFLLEQITISFDLVIVKNLLRRLKSLYVRTKDHCGVWNNRTVAIRELMKRLNTMGCSEHRTACKFNPTSIKTEADYVR